MPRSRFIVPLGVVVAGLLLNSASYGNIKYNKLEKRTCVTCHTSIKGKELNAVGKCYQKTRKLAACESK